MSQLFHSIVLGKEKLFFSRKSETAFQYVSFFLKLTLCTEHEKEQRWNIKLLGKPRLLQHMWKITNVMLAHMVMLHVMKPVLQSVAHVRAPHHKLTSCS